MDPPRELLKARINFDLTGKNAQQRMLYGVLGVTVTCVVLAVRTGGDAVAFSVAGALWVLVMAVFGIGFVVTRKRNAKFAARLRAAGFTPVTEEGGRVRYLPRRPPGRAGRQPHHRPTPRVRATFHSGHPQPQAGNASCLPSVLIPPVPDLSTGEPWRRHDSP